MSRRQTDGSHQNNSGPVEKHLTEDPFAIIMVVEDFSLLDEFSAAYMV